MNINTEDLLQTITEFVSVYALKVVVAVAIFLIGRIIAKLVVKWLKLILESRKVEASLVSFTAALTQAIIMTFIVITALGQLGVQTTSFVAVIGAAGLAIGLALQGSLSNFAAGVLIIIFKPYKIGDYVQAGGGEGEVNEIGIFTTTLVTLDNRTQIIPNSAAMGGMIDNFSAQGTRRLDLVAGVSYSDDIRKVKQVLQEILDNEPRILPEPEPTIGLMEMGDSSINFAFRPWVKVDDYWDLYFDLQEQIKIRFDEEKITIPFPQRDVHLFREEA